MTRNEAKAALDVVLNDLKYHRAEHVHVADISAQQCSAMYAALTEVRLMLDKPLLPDLRTLAVRHRDRIFAGPEHVTEMNRDGTLTVTRTDDLLLLCDAVLALTADGTL